MQQQQGMHQNFEIFLSLIKNKVKILELGVVLKIISICAHETSYNILQKEDANNKTHWS